jgi:hypothetical protein
VWCYFRCLVQACYREARHLGPPTDAAARCKGTGDFAAAAALCQSNRAALKGLRLWEQTKVASTITDVIEPYMAASGLLPEQLPSLFTLDSWHYNFGGRRWATIAEVMVHLRDAIDAADAPRAEALCEESRRLRHNSGPLVPGAESWRAHAWQREKWPELCE